MSVAMNISQLRQGYKTGELTPQALLSQCLETIRGDSQSNAWISVISDEVLADYLKQLETKPFEESPLWGIPFAIKDNIDLATCSTTAGCPSYSYQPEEDAFVVQQLIAAGAVPLGKTNMDQFATGLVGTRSPYGAVPSVFSEEHISGGSSSGSAYAVANGQVSFALGTDTAGSGRVPAAFNNLLGTKPTRGLLSNRGVVPACRSLDCVTFFTLNGEDAQLLLSVAGQYDEEDPYSRKSHAAGSLAQKQFTVGIAKQSQLLFLNEDYKQLYQAACKQLQQAGAVLKEIDLDPMLQAAKLLYDGPWVAERYHAVGAFIEQDGKDLDPTVAGIVANGNGSNAVDAFDAFYQLQALKKQADAQLDGVDCIVTPTVPGQFTHQEIAEEPVARNSQLGYYTNFMNLLDYSALAIPAGFTGNSLPFGITLFAPAFSDMKLNQIAQLYLKVKSWGMGKLDTTMALSDQIELGQGFIPVAVCGAHLSGMPLNWQLTDRDAILQSVTTTASAYQFYALAGGPPYRPGLKRVDSEGAAIDVEVWLVPERAFGSFVAGIPAPLGIGKLELADGSWVPGFICEPYGLDDALDITEMKNWRRYIESLPSKA